MTREHALAVWECFDGWVASLHSAEGQDGEREYWVEVDPLVSAPQMLGMALAAAGAAGAHDVSIGGKGLMLR